MRQHKENSNLPTKRKTYFVAGLAAVAGPLLKALDAKSTDFGKGAK